MTCDLRLANVTFGLMSYNLRLATCNLRLVACDLQLVTCDLRLMIWCLWLATCDFGLLHILPMRITDSTKINRPEHNIRMYWTNFRQPTANVQQNIFGKILIEVCCLHLYASFGTFCIQIGQLFATQWFFKHSEEFRNWQHFPAIKYMNFV